MKIYSMTATFGKLEHETLTLQPGLNIIEAPNEWGKSTWCAFLVAMLYGMDTRAHTTKTALADKERYAPWSGSPMSGRIDLNWNGRDISIERRTKGRSILGDFKAYETDSGLPVPDLTAANCGQTLLGVEKSVFTRAGFLKFTDLPVTQDESLRRRLNALVTTGDESGTGDQLARQLRDLKNRCRYNRSGLLPQAEAQRGELEGKLRELESLQTQSERFLTRKAELEDFQAQLNNHKTALEYAAAQSDAGRVAEAAAARDQAARQLKELEAGCDSLPPRDEAERAVRSLQELRQQWASLQMEAQMLPQPPAQPEPPAPFRGMTPAEAADRAENDSRRYRALMGEKMLPLLLIAILAFLAGGTLLFYHPPYAWIVFGVCAGVLILWAGLILRSRKKARDIAGRYGSGDTAAWLAAAGQYADDHKAYLRALEDFRSARGDLDSRTAALREQMDTLCGGETLQARLDRWQRIIQCWDALSTARREYQRASSHAADMQAMAKSAKAPEFPDKLTYTPAETARLLSDTAASLHQLQLRLGQCQGQMESLGSKARLEQQLAAVRERIARLEDTYAALELAQTTLAAATAELQRRFAPRISQRAQTLFGKLTGERYDRLTLGEDLSLQAGARGEDTLRSSMWRSDGTVDQLYLALRLAVAEELTPEAPLILDDALVRFDDTRLKAAMDILREAAQTKQVIVFTCQSREKQF